MAEYIRQLLELDDCSRRETLNSLSQYSETKCSNGSSCADEPRASGSSDAGTSSASGVPTGLGVSLPEAMSSNVEGLDSGRLARSLAEQCALEAMAVAVRGGPDIPLDSWATTVQIGSRDADLARRAYWSAQLATPMGLATDSDMQEPMLQALPPGPLPLMWDTREPSPAGFPVMRGYSAHAAAPKHRKSQELQRSMDSPSSGAAHQNGGASCYAKGGRAIQTHSSQLASDTLPSDLHGESASKLQNDKDIERQSLGSYLNYLKQIDAGRILLARKINRLGFDSAAVLADHYSTYGNVEHVFVPRSRSVARSQSNRPFVRSRPSGIGFVVMSASQAVDAILQEGEAQCVAGETVQLQRFRRQSFCEETEEEVT